MARKEKSNVHNALDFRYYGGGKVFPVEPQDAVVAFVDGKQKVMGYNHDRAWTAARNA